LSTQSETRSWDRAAPTCRAAFRQSRRNQDSRGSATPMGTSRATGTPRAPC